MRVAFILLTLGWASLSAQPRYDLVLKGGHVIDPKNSINRAMDLAISGGKIVLVAPNISPSDAKKTVDVAGLYVTPGLIDIHVHIYLWPDLKGEGVSLRRSLDCQVDLSQLAQFFGGGGN